MDEEQLFEAARHIESPGERATYLAEACGEDAELRVRVERLLASHEGAGGFLQPPELQVDSVVDSTSATEGPGSVIGRYKLLEHIGEGGFGDVYMAEQTEPVRRKVAVKIIKLGMDTRQVIARFEAERQALALMDHPNIAKVLDAGATETGRPYFVMELVRGIPVTEYCDAHDLTTKERLGLFIHVCHAVQHAHQKGIIHRDIKPTNVLVTVQDGRPVPQVIDFGIAKATKRRLTEKTLFTQHRQLVGTPEYMSPEQATFYEADVDTRTDVYSLGVLLYELLVGTTPFDAEALRGQGYDEICRVIRESDPPTPSKRLSTLGDAVTDISRHRHVEPAGLRKLLRGDLDWIVMKTLEKNRTRRYETVHGLARDIERHLSDEPVRARPPSAGYRLEKFVRKHRLVVASSLAVLAALAVGLTLTAVGFVRAERERGIAAEERDRAVENLRLARQLMSDVVLPAVGRMTDFPFAQEYQQEVLEKARIFYEQILKQSGHDPKTRREMAGIHRHLGTLAWDSGQDAEPALRQSISMLEDLVKEFPGHPDYRQELGESHTWLSIWYQEDMRREESLAERRKSHAILAELSAENASPEKYRNSLALSNTGLADRLVGVGKLDEALPHYQSAITASGQLSAFTRVLSREGYANLLLRLARYDEAEQVLSEALEIAEREMAPAASPLHAGWGVNAYRLSRCHYLLGQLCFYTGRFAAAEQHLRGAITPLATWVDIYPQAVWFRYHLGWCRQALAEVLTVTGRMEEAEAARRQSLVAWESAGNPVAAAIPRGKRIAHYRLGELLHYTGRTAEAAGEFAEALAIMGDLWQRRSKETVCHWQFICLLANCPDASFRDPPRAVALAQRVLPPNDGHFWRYLALAQYRSGDWPGAAESIQQAMELRQGGDAIDWLLLAMARWQLGEQEEAREWYARATAAFAAREPVFYEYVGVLAVRRLQSEAESLLHHRSGDAGSATSTAMETATLRT